MSRCEPLSATQLCWHCAPDSFTFETTAELEDLSEVIGQQRAVEAMTFAFAMTRPGYNLFALGPRGIGKHTVVRHFMERAAKQVPVPDDWCYVSNFKEPRKPKALRLPAGHGAQFQADMSRFVEDVKVALRSAFESEEYRTRQQIIEEELRERREQSLAGIEQEAVGKGVALLRTPIGFAFGPVKDGKVVSPEQFSEYPEDEKKQIQEVIDELQEKLKAAVQQAPVWMKEAQDKIRELNDETAMFAVGHLVETLRSKYQDQVEVVTFLNQVRDDMVKQVQAFIATPDQAKIQAAGVEQEDGHPLFRRYRVNLIVSHGNGEHAPVVYEDEPTMDRLVGRVEHRAEMGALLTDLHMIRPGALHRANGGFLILDARKLLTRPMAWDALKHALSSGKIRTEPLGQAMGLISTVTLEPESIPFQVKVALIGDREIYYLLAQHDPEFLRFFKVAADFDERFERGAAHNLLYARLIGTVARKESLRPFDRAAVGRVLERSSRRAGDSERLSTAIEALSDLLQVADHWAGLDGAEVVGPNHVQKAIDAHERQLDRMRERIQEEIQRDTIVINTDGAEVGQINGLAVLQLGDFAFGKPSRITARVRLGKGEVIDIEREVALGGPLHAKGVLILSGYLSSHYASDRPLSLSASLVFEQSYGGVDGDSASSTELYALLSAIAEVPIRQGFAVTGSVNQRGEVQAIGGVNEKIEGFFDLCKARGLDGNQGVLIPASNVKHLMLHRRVVDAVEAGTFSVYAVETIDQGIEILTGMSAGQRGDDGHFPADSLNRRVEDRLIALAEMRRSFGQAAKTEGAE